MFFGDFYSLYILSDECNCPADFNVRNLWGDLNVGDCTMFLTILAVLVVIAIGLASIGLVVWIGCLVLTGLGFVATHVVVPIASFAIKMVFYGAGALIVMGIGFMMFLVFVSMMAALAV